MRVALAAVLFAEPDLLLLDEPTNHLDLEASLWLEDYLCRYPRTLLLISHDRHLLNRVPERIVHLDQQRLTSYTGGYDAFERVRRERLVLLEKERAKQEASARHMQAFVDRFRYKASKARQAQSRLKALARLEPIAEVIGAPDVVLRFPAPAGAAAAPDHARAGARGLRRRRSCSTGSICASTRTIASRCSAPTATASRPSPSCSPGGSRRWRARSCARPKLRVGYFAQHQIEELRARADARSQHLAEALPDLREQRLRARLGALRSRPGEGRARRAACSRAARRRGSRSP